MTLVFSNLLFLKPSRLGRQADNGLETTGVGRCEGRAAPFGHHGEAPCLTDPPSPAPGAVIPGGESTAASVSISKHILFWSHVRHGCCRLGQVLIPRSRKLDLFGDNRCEMRFRNGDVTLCWRPGMAVDDMEAILAGGSG